MNRRKSRNILTLVVAALIAGSAVSYLSAADQAPGAAAATSQPDAPLNARRERLNRIWLEYEKTQSAKTPPALIAPKDGHVLAWPADFPKKLGGTSVTIHFSGTPADAIAELTRQTGVQFQTTPAPLLQHGNWPAVKLDGDAQPLMNVVMRLCSQSGLRITPTEQPARPGPTTTQWILLSRNEANRTVGDWCICGPFVFELQRLTGNADLSGDLRGPPQLDLDFLLFRQPGVRVLVASHTLNLDEAADELGNSLIGTKPQPTTPFQTNEQLTALLSIPKNTGKLIHHFRAHYHCVVQTSSETVELDDLPRDNSVGKSAGGMGLKIGPIVIGANNEIELPIEFQRGQRDPNDWANLRTVMDKCEPALLDADGGKIEREQANTQGSGDDWVAVNFTYSTRSVWGGATGAPRKLIVEVPTDIRAIDVPIEFSDLPRP